jgi:hypothetical protein
MDSFLCKALTVDGFDLVDCGVEPHALHCGRQSKTVADLIHAVVYSEKACTSFIVIVDGWPLCDHLL